jgi:hypothetical protein
MSAALAAEPGGEVDGPEGDEGHGDDEEVEEAPGVREKLGEGGKGHTSVRSGLDRFDHNVTTLTTISPLRSHLTTVTVI